MEENYKEEDSRSEAIAIILGVVVIVLSFVIYYKNDTIHDLKTPPMPAVPIVGTEVVCETDGVTAGSWYIGTVTKTRTKTKYVYQGSGFTARVNSNQCEELLK